MPGTSPTRVVVADDSAFMRRMLSAALADAGMEVVGLAADGNEALALCERLRPDVLSLDLAMPGRDGIGVLRELRARRLRIPVVVVSAFSPAHGAHAVDALAEGAFELVAKPGARDGLDPFAAELGEKVQLAAASGWRSAPAPAPERAAGEDAVRPAASGDRRLVVIACSTGGPRALAALLPLLPSSLGEGTLIVQHMPPGFTGSLAQRLDGASPLTVREARDADAIAPGLALLAPGGSHLRLASSGGVSLSDDPPVGGLRPRADVTIEDAAALWGERLLLVVLTGMGRDGLAGARAVRRAGGRILVEAKSSCVVHGMPRAVAEARLADAEVDLAALPQAIAAEAGR